MASIYSSHSSDQASEANAVSYFSCSTSSSSSSSLSSVNNSYTGRNGYIWSVTPPHSSAYRSSNILRFPSGLSHAVRDCNDHLDFFDFFLDSIFRDHTLHCTNERIPSSEQPITTEKFSGFMGILIYIGLRQSNHIDLSEIWSPASMFFMEEIALTMPRNRFYLILRNLSFYPRSSAGTKFDKIQFCFERFREKVTAAFEPGANLCVDEILYSFRGNCSWRQYMPSKPAKYGQKYWCVVDVSSSYLCNFGVYLGRDATRTAPVGESVVMKLCDPFLNAGRNITTDNFFTSIPLAERLFEQNTTLVGTIKSNKPHLPTMTQKSRTRPINATQFIFHDWVTVASYVPKRNRVVNVVSTQHHSATIEANGKPAIIGCYNETKGGVDTVAHLIANNTCRRKTRRWTTNTFFFILDTAVHNSYVLHAIKHEIMPNEERRRSKLADLAKKLCVPAIRFRCSQWQSNNASGIPSNIVEAATKRGFFTRPQLHQSEISIGRCFLCPKSRTARNACIQCNKYVCRAHSVNRKVLCESCL